MAACLDERPGCPRCGGRLNGKYPICQHCGTGLEWASDRPLSAELVERQRQEACIQEKERPQVEFGKSGNSLLNGIKNVADRLSMIDESHGDSLVQSGEDQSTQEESGCESKSRADRLSWQCKECQEAIPDSFDLCWNCGADREVSTVETG
jgi:hypothetical protein